MGALNCCVAGWNFVGEDIKKMVGRLNGVIILVFKNSRLIFLLHGFTTLVLILNGFKCV